MFNVFLPKLLERRLGGMTPDPSRPSVKSGVRIRSVESSLEDSLWDVVIYSIGGCPGAIVGALIGLSYRNRLKNVPFYHSSGLIWLNHPSVDDGRWREPPSSPPSSASFLRKSMNLYF